MKKFLVSLAIPALLGITVSLISQSRNSGLSELTKTNIEALARAASVEVEHDVLINGEGCIVTNMSNRFLRKGCKVKQNHFCVCDTLNDYLGDLIA